MKFLSWLFNATTRHHGDIIRYEKGKLSTKIFTIFLMFFFAGATLGLEYWCIGLAHSNLLAALLVSILVVAFTAATFDYCAIFSYIGFKMFIFGTLSSIIEKIDQKSSKKKQKKAEENQTEEIQTEANQAISVDIAPTQENSKKQKSHMFIDLLVAILGLTIAIATLVSMIVIFIKLLY